MEEFEKIWQEALDEYETIPDKSKIDEADKAYVNGFYRAVDFMQSILYNYLNVEDLDAKELSTLDKIKKEIIENYDSFAKGYMEGKVNEVITAILDGYVK